MSSLQEGQKDGYHATCLEVQEYASALLKAADKRIAELESACQSMLLIFQWMHDNPGCHPQNMRAEAKRMLDKYGSV